MRLRGYPTRLVTGFYADARRYDRRAGQTAVVKEDTHVWLEVALGQESWIPVEPTPGYEPPRMVLTWSESAWMFGARVLAWAAAHWPFVSALFGLAVYAVWKRRPVVDALAWLVWRAALLGGPRRAVLATMRLLECRAWLAGCSRPHHRTVSAWHGRWLPAESAAAETVRQVMALFDWVLYAPHAGDEAPVPAIKVKQMCRTAVRAASLRTMRTRRLARVLQRRGVDDRHTRRRDDWKSPFEARDVHRRSAGDRNGAPALNRALVGKQEVTELVLACLLAHGHLLFDDLPGLGKTTLAKALAHAVHGRFARVQCTPDLLPGDITGFNIFNQKIREFEFLPGPVFSDVLLADEINRATPRTQSALFEAMAERQVTIDGTSRELSPTFFVIATQNPVESHGAYPLPEAQLDRFAMKLRIGYPDRASELEMLATQKACDHSRDGRPAAVIGLATLMSLQDEVGSVAVADNVREYLVDLGRVTREHRAVQLGLSPARGLLIWQRVAQARAWLLGRHFVTPDDIQDVAVPVLSVRLVGDFDSAERMIAEILARSPCPSSHRHGDFSTVTLR